MILSMMKCSLALNRINPEEEKKNQDFYQELQKKKLLSLKFPEKAKMRLKDLLPQSKCEFLGWKVNLRVIRLILG